MSKSTSLDRRLQLAAAPNNVCELHSPRSTERPLRNCFPSPERTCGIRQDTLPRPGGLSMPAQIDVHLLPDHLDRAMNAIERPSYPVRNIENCRERSKYWLKVCATSSAG